MQEFLSEHVNPESVTSFVDNSGRDNVIMQHEEAAAEADKEESQEQDRLADVLARLARLRIFTGIVANLNRGGTAKLRTEEEVNAAPFFTEDLAEIERFLKEESYEPDGMNFVKERFAAAAYEEARQTGVQHVWQFSPEATVSDVKVTRYARE